MSNITKLNFYTKGKSIIRGNFLVSTDDPKDCLTTSDITVRQNDFIEENYAARPVEPISCGNGGGFSPFYLNDNYCSEILIDLQQSGSFGNPPPTYTSLNTVLSSDKFLVKTIEESNTWDYFNSVSKLRYIGNYESKKTITLNSVGAEITNNSGYLNATFSYEGGGDFLGATSIICEYSLTLNNSGWSGDLRQTVTGPPASYYGSYSTTATNYSTGIGAYISSETELLPEGQNPAGNRIDNLNAPIPFNNVWVGSILQVHLIANGTGYRKLLYPCVNI
jgi:hypothetical protein